MAGASSRMHDARSATAAGLLGEAPRYFRCARACFLAAPLLAGNRISPHGRQRTDPYYVIMFNGLILYL